MIWRERKQITEVSDPASHTQNGTPLWLLPLSTQGFYRAGMSHGGREDQGLYQKEPRAHPNSPNPAELQEPPFLSRTDMAIRVGQAGNSGPGVSPLPIPALQASPDPQELPPPQDLSAPSLPIQAEMRPVTRQAPNY